MESALDSCEVAQLQSDRLLTGSLQVRFLPSQPWECSSMVEQVL